MGYALKIYNVDFSSSALDRVSYIDPIPCEEITLDQETLTFTRLETSLTLEPSLTPVDTTDVVRWSSSDDRIATVIGGVVTVHGVGTVTITATCGEVSATATVVASSLRMAGEMVVVEGKYVSPNNVTGGQTLSIDTISGQYTVGQTYNPDDTDIHILGGSGSGVENIRVPFGATKIHFGTTDGNSVSVSYTYISDATDTVQYNNVDYPKYLEQITFMNTATGATVAYGKCVAFRVMDTQIGTLSYIYFT